MLLPGILECLMVPVHWATPDGLLTLPWILPIGFSCARTGVTANARRLSQTARVRFICFSPWERRERTARGLNTFQTSQTTPAPRRDGGIGRGAGALANGPADRSTITAKVKLIGKPSTRVGTRGLDRRLSGSRCLQPWLPVTARLCAHAQTALSKERW